MVNLSTILDLLRVEGKQNIFIIDEDGNPLKYGTSSVGINSDGTTDVN